MEDKVYEEMKIEFDSAISSVTVERGLSNIEGFRERYQQAFDEIYPNPAIVFGNKKVPKTTAIVNTTSWFLCPGRLQGFCELHEVCYDKCREVMGSVNRSRLNHDLWWRSNDARTIAMFISYSIKAQSMRGDEKVNLLRFQEVGDFRNQDDLEKMRDVSDIVYEQTGIKSYTYTHNRSLDFDIDRKYLTICGSGFMVDNQFTVVKPDNYKRYVEEHDCIECPQKCKMCNSICSKKLGVEIVEVEK